MKNIYLYSLLAGALCLASCQDDYTPVMSVKSNAVLEEMPQNEYVFNTANATEPFVIKWKPVDLGFQPVNTYTVMMKNSANGETVKLGDTTTNELQLTNAQINASAGHLFVYPGKSAEMTVYLSYSAYNGKLDSIADNTINFKVTPYDPKAVTWDYVYVAEGYPKFDFTKAYMLGDVDADGEYEGYVNFAAAGAGFAILNKKMEVLAGENAVNNAGFCKLNYSNASSTVTQSGAAIVWGVIGDATPGSWDTDTQMDYSTDTRLWTKVVRLAKGKDFKFRGNNDWGINLGALKGHESDMSGDLMANGENLKVVAEKDTTFLITLNLTEAGKYSFTTKVTAFEQSSEYITMPGSYQGWNGEDPSCYRLTSPGRDFVFSGAHYIPDNTEFKLYDKGTWTGIDGNISWNVDNTGGSFAISIGGGGNILIAKGDYYKFTANTLKKTVTFIKTGWGLIGAGSPSGNWDTDTMMNYDPATKLWSVTANLVGGEMKFRWDKGWDKNLGGSLSALTQGGDNIVVPAGTYLITLDDVALKATMVKQ